jgi:hypothetical protein
MDEWWTAVNAVINFFFQNGGELLNYERVLGFQVEIWGM